MSKKLTQEQKEEFIENFKKYNQKNKERYFRTKVDKSEIQNKNKRKLNKGIIKNKTNIFTRVKNAVLKTILTTFVGFSMLVGSNMVVKYTNNKAKNKAINTALDYYGGASKYLGKGLFGIYNRFKTEDTRHIIVGYDKSVDENIAKQLDYCIDYINKMFSVINPNYHFETKFVNSKKECNILIDVCDLVKEYNREDNIAAITHNRSTSNAFFDYYDYCNARISFNDKYINEPVGLRYTMLHELEHVLLVNYDLEYDHSNLSHNKVPYSLLSYQHINNIIANKRLKYEYDSGGKSQEEIIDECFGYTPFDLAAFVANYGDFESVENKIACTKLIVDTYKEFKNTFGDRKYFLDDTDLNEEGYPKRFEQFVIKSNTSNKNDNVKTYVFTIDKDDDFSL